MGKPRQQTAAIVIGAQQVIATDRGKTCAKILGPGSTGMTAGPMMAKPPSRISRPAPARRVAPGPLFGG
jgi:hypothetical protein